MLVVSLAQLLDRLELDDDFVQAVEEGVEEQERPALEKLFR